MSEKHIPRLENPQSKEKPADSEINEHAEKRITEQAELARNEKAHENIDKIRELAKAEAKNTEKVNAQENSVSESDSGIGMQHSLKAAAYERVLDNTRRSLSKPARTFSKITHNPTIDKISSIGSKTVARPSGFLGGSIFAFLGSSVVYYFSKHYGFKYNYLLVIIFFVGGYIVGALLELLVWLVYTRKQRY